MSVSSPQQTPTTHRVGMAQVTGSTVAAVAGAFCATRLGLAGTLSGVALGSVVGTLGSTVVTRHLQRARAALPLPVVRSATPAGPGEDVEPAPTVAVHPQSSRSTSGWRQGLIAATVAACVSVAALMALTLVEGVTGQPIAALALEAGRRWESNPASGLSEVWSHLRTLAA